MSSFTAGVFFLRFWRDTRDPFFLAFAASFIIEGLNRSATLLLDNPSEGSAWTYVIRLAVVSPYSNRDSPKEFR